MGGGVEGGEGGGATSVKGASFLGGVGYAPSVVFENLSF